MAVLTVSGLSKSFGTDVLFENVNFEIDDNSRVGFIGANGTGKTTLFRILMGLEPYDSGSISRGKNTVVGYMEQHVCADSGKSAYEEVLTEFSSLIEAENEIERITEKLSENPENPEELIEKQAYLRECFERDGGLTFRSRARSALIGLGFSDTTMENAVDVLSGGQKAKLSLAKLLLSNSNFLLLDEPTNHLDITSVEWLEGFLKAYKGAFIVISHDRFFLDSVTNKTISLHGEKISVYGGNYSVYLKQKAEDDLSAKRRYDNTVKEIERLNGIVEQQRRWNREKNIKTAESKLKVIERLEKTLEKPESADRSISLGFKASRRSGDEVLKCEDLSLSFGNTEIFKNASLDIRRGEHIFLIGENGCGKTSFLKILLGMYTQNSGKFKFGAGVETGYYDQAQSGLHSEKRVIDEIWDEYPNKTETEVRSALALFLFTNDDVFKKISALSGGEKARVLLLKLMLSKANFLLLDEPTNHLDILSCQALENALHDYDGTLLIVSHDRYLMNKIADKIYFLSKNGTKLFDGNYDFYLEKRELAEEKNPAPKAKINDNKLRRESEAELKKLKIELSRTERAAEEADEKIKNLHTLLESPEIQGDYKAMLETLAEIDEASKASDELVSHWETLSLKIEQTEQMLKEL